MAETAIDEHPHRLQLILATAWFLALAMTIIWFVVYGFQHYSDAPHCTKEVIKEMQQDNPQGVDEYRAQCQEEKTKEALCCAPSLLFLVSCGYMFLRSTQKLSERESAFYKRFGFYGFVVTQGLQAIVGFGDPSMELVVLIALLSMILLVGLPIWLRQKLFVD